MRDDFTDSQLPRPRPVKVPAASIPTGGHPLLDAPCGLDAASCPAGLLPVVCGVFRGFPYLPTFNPQPPARR